MVRCLSCTIGDAMSTIVYSAYSESGKYIGDYSRADAKAVFGKRNAKVLGSRIIVKDIVIEQVSAAQGWRRLDNGDGTYSIWSPEAYKRITGAPLLSTVRFSPHRFEPGDKVQTKGGWIEVQTEGKRASQKKTQQEGKRIAKSGGTSSKSAPQKNLSVAKGPSGALSQNGRDKSIAKEASFSPKRIESEEILAEVMNNHDEGVGKQLETMFGKKTMEGVIRIVMAIAGNLQNVVLPEGFSLDADDLRVKNYYSQSFQIRYFCFDFIARLIERMGDSSMPFGSEPLTWAINNCLSDSRLKRRAARQIIAEREHTLVFSESCIEEAMGCEESLTFIPYKTTLVRIPGHEVASWGVVAMQDGGEISLVTIGDEGLTDTARNMLAYVENCCRSWMNDDGNTGYRPINTSSPRHAPCGVDMAEGECMHKIIRGAVSSTADAKQRTHQSGAVIAPYTRRAHTRRQHYGAGNRFIKIVTIRETLVKGGCKDLGRLPKSMRVHFIS